MTVFEQIKENASLISTLGLTSALASAALVWLTTISIDEEVALATTVGERVIIMAFVIPLIVLGFLYYRRNTLTGSASTLAIAFGLIGFGSGLFCAMIYLYIGFQIPSLVKSVDIIVHMDNMLPALIPGSIATIITTTITSAVGVVFFRQSDD